MSGVDVRPSMMSDFEPEIEGEVFWVRDLCFVICA
ncbi:MAG: hypothetical protein RL591_912 [Planctomycetota bacterium]|jgi:hypothetical protein